MHVHSSIQFTTVHFSKLTLKHIQSTRTTRIPFSYCALSTTNNTIVSICLWVFDAAKSIETQLLIKVFGCPKMRFHNCVRKGGDQVENWTLLLGPAGGGCRRPGAPGWRSLSRDAGLDKNLQPAIKTRSKNQPSPAAKHATAGSLSTKCPSVIYYSGISLRQEVATTGPGGTMIEATWSHGCIYNLAPAGLWICSLHTCNSNYNIFFQNILPPKKHKYARSSFWSKSIIATVILAKNKQKKTTTIRRSCKVQDKFSKFPPK